MVVDRNRITGGGVTAGIDFGLTLAGALAGDEVARRIALGLEYAPAPPFPGSPRSAAPGLVAGMVEGDREAKEATTAGSASTPPRGGGCCRRLRRYSPARRRAPAIVSTPGPPPSRCATQMAAPCGCSGDCGASRTAP